MQIKLGANSAAAIAAASSMPGSVSRIMCRDAVINALLTYCFISSYSARLIQASGTSSSVTRRGLSLSPSTNGTNGQNAPAMLCFPATESQAIRAQRRVFLPESRYEHYRLAKRLTRPIKAKRRRQMTILRTSG